MMMMMTIVQLLVVEIVEVVVVVVAVEVEVVGESCHVPFVFFDLRCFLFHWFFDPRTSTAVGANVRERRKF